MPLTPLTLTSRALSIYDLPDETTFLESCELLENRGDDEPDEATSRKSCKPVEKRRMSAKDVDEALKEFEDFKSKWMTGGRLCRSVFSQTHGKEFGQELALWYARLLRITMSEARRFEADEPVYLSQVVKGLKAIYQSNQSIINQGKSRLADATTFLQQRNAFHRHDDDLDYDCVYHQPFVNRFRDVRFRLDSCSDIDEGLQHLAELASLHRNAALGPHRTCLRAIAESTWQPPPSRDDGLKTFMAMLRDVHLD